jgi:hypothetical protein
MAKGSLVTRSSFAGSFWDKPPCIAPENCMWLNIMEVNIEYKWMFNTHTHTHTHVKLMQWHQYDPPCNGTWSNMMDTSNSNFLFIILNSWWSMTLIWK